MPPTPRSTVTSEDVRQILGDVDDLMISEIVAAGMSFEELCRRARDLARETWDDEDEYRAD